MAKKAQKKVSLSFFDDVIDVYVDLFVHKWKCYFWSMLFPLFVIIIAGGLLTLLFFLFFDSSSVFFQLQNSMFGLIFLGFIAAVLSLFALYVFLRLYFGFVRQVLAPKPVQTLQGVWKDGEPFFLPLLRFIGFSLIVFAVVAVVGGALFFFSEIASEYSSVLEFFVNFLIVVAYIAYFYFIFRLIFVSYLIIDEGSTIGEAFSKSWNMTKRYFWKFVGTLFLFYIIAVLAFYSFLIFLFLFGGLYAIVLTSLFGGGETINSTMGLLFGVPGYFLVPGGIIVTFVAMVYFYYYSLILFPFYKVLLPAVKK